MFSQVVTPKKIILQMFLSQWKLIGKVILRCSAPFDDGVTQFRLYESLVLFLVSWVNPPGSEAELGATGGAPGPPALQEFVALPGGGKECLESLQEAAKSCGWSEIFKRKHPVRGDPQPISPIGCLSDGDICRRRRTGVS